MKKNTFSRIYEIQAKQQPKRLDFNVIDDLQKAIREATGIGNTYKALNLDNHRDKISKSLSDTYQMEKECKRILQELNDALNMAEDGISNLGLSTSDIPDYSKAVGLLDEVEEVSERVDNAVSVLERVDSLLMQL